MLKTKKIFLKYYLNSKFINFILKVRKFLSLFFDNYYKLFDNNIIKVNYKNLNNKINNKNFVLKIGFLENIRIISYIGLIDNFCDRPVNIFSKKYFKKKKDLRFYQPYYLNKNVKKINGLSFFYCNPGRNIFNYFHFLIDLGSQLFLLKFSNIKINNIILFSKKNKHRDKFIKKFFPNIRIYNFQRNQIIPVQNLVSLKPYYMSGEIVKKNMNFFFKKYLLFLKKSLPRENATHRKIIFVNRHESRVVNNLNALKKEIKMKEVFFSDQQSISRQSRIINKASVIIGIHGAGLANIIFANKNTKVIELIPEYYADSCYEQLSRSLGLNYFKVKLKKGKLNTNFIKNSDIKNIKQIVRG